MILGQFNPSIVQQQVNQQVQKAGSQLGASANSSTKAEDAGQKMKKAGEDLSAKLAGSKKTEETGKQEETKKKKEAEQKKANFQQLGSEAFVPKEEEEKTDPAMKDLDNFRKQAEQFKRTGQFAKSSGKEISHFSKPQPGGKFSLKMPKVKHSEGDKGTKSTIAEEIRDQIQVHSDDGQMQLQTGLTTKEAKKGRETDLEKIEAKEETKKKKEAVTEKQQQDNREGGMSNEHKGDIDKLEKIEKIKRSTPARDAAEATDSLREFQEKTGLSTKALKTSKAIASTVLTETDETKKSKRTRMKSVPSTRKIETNAKPAPMKDIKVKNAPVAVIPTGGMTSGETELVETRLPENKAEGSLMESAAPVSSDIDKKGNQTIGGTDFQRYETLMEPMKDLPPQNQIGDSLDRSTTVGFNNVSVEKSGEHADFNKRMVLVDGVKSEQPKNEDIIFDGKEHNLFIGEMSVNQDMTPKEFGMVSNVRLHSTPDKNDPNRVMLKGNYVNNYGMAFNMEGQSIKTTDENGKPLTKLNLKFIDPATGQVAYTKEYTQTPDGKGFTETGKLYEGDKPFDGDKPLVEKKETKDEDEVKNKYVWNFEGKPGKSAPSFLKKTSTAMDFTDGMFKKEKTVQTPAEPAVSQA